MIAALVLATVGTPASDGEIWLSRMSEAWKRVSTMTYRLRKLERMRDGEIVEEEVAVKLRKPLCVYVAALKPRRGQEIIYDTTRDPTRFVVHPGRFPDLTLRLAVDGSLATERQHHRLSHTGLDYIIAKLSPKASTVDQPRVIDAGESLFRGRPVHWVRIETAGRSELVAARRDETLFAYAERVGQDVYYIYYNNPDIDDVTDELSPKAYRVFPGYGRRSEIAVDRETHLPVRVSVWDEENRLYEQLDFDDIVIDAPLHDLDFDPDNPAYGF